MNRLKIVSFILMVALLLLALPVGRGGITGAAGEIPPEVQDLCEEQGGEIISWDECNYGGGYSIPGPAGGDPYCNTPDCCACYQTTHVHDLGQVIPVADLILRYASGFTQGCQDYLTVEVSPDDVDWTWVEEIPTTSESLNGGWEIYTVKLHNIQNFQYVRMTIPNCYIDYSAAYACVAEEVGKPDLVIVGKWEKEVEGGYEVTYTVRNLGNAVAPSGHDTTLYVDGEVIEHQMVPYGLDPYGSLSGKFSTVIKCSGTSDTIKVCADNYDEVDELNEYNNCLTNTYSCPGEEKPNLEVTKYEQEMQPGSYRIYYTVRNTGSTDAPANHWVYVWVDGGIVHQREIDWIMQPGSTSSYACQVYRRSPSPDKIKVCVDYFDSVDESDETDNCAENEYSYVEDKPNLEVTKWEEETQPGAYKIHYTVRNTGSAYAPANHWVYVWQDGGVVHQKKIDWAMKPGSYVSGSFGVRCYSPSPDKIKVCADYFDSVDESNETDNCAENEYSYYEEEGAWSPPPPAAEEEQMICINPASQSVGPGVSSVVSIHVDPADTGISGGSITVSFEPDVMQVDNVEAGDLLGIDPIMAPGYPKIDNVNGVVDIDLARRGSTVSPTPSGEFAIIMFTVRADIPEGFYSVNFTKAEFLDENFADISGIVITDGIIQILAGYAGGRWDINQGGEVDYADLAVLAAHYGETTTSPYPRWDINEDGKIDYKDLAILGAHYGETY